MATKVQPYSGGSVTGWNNVTVATLTGLPTIPKYATLDDVTLSCNVKRAGGVTAKDAEVKFQLNGSNIHSINNMGRETRPFNFSIKNHIVNNNGTLAYSSGATSLNIVCYHRNNQLTGAATWTASDINITVTYTEHTHSYTSTVTKQPTCIETGVKTYTCSCGDSYTETIPAKGHTEVTLSAVAPTCTATGLTEGKKCSACNTVTVAQQTVAKNPNNHSGSQITRSAVAPTCENTGLTEGKAWSCCNVIITAQQTVAALGHNYTSQVIPPTAAVDGYTLHTCQNGCGNSYKDTYTINKIFFGTTQPSKIYYGTQEVKEVYFGTTKVFGLR